MKGIGREGREKKTSERMGPLAWCTFTNWASGPSSVYYFQARARPSYTRTPIMADALNLSVLRRHDPTVEEVREIEEKKKMDAGAVAARPNAGRAAHSSGRFQAVAPASMGTPSSLQKLTSQAVASLCAQHPLSARIKQASVDLSVFLTPPVSFPSSRSSPRAATSPCTITTRRRGRG